jgi:hypothetical protein
MSLLEEAAIAGEILRRAAQLGPEAYRAIHAAITETRPELAPAELPERADGAIAAATDALIRERFHRKSEAPKG